MSDKKTVNVGLRLTAEYVEALERYRVDKEQEVRQLVSGYNMSLSASARALIEDNLRAGGYVKGVDKQPVSKPIEQPKPRKQKTRSTDKIEVEPNSKQAQVIQALIDGWSGTGRDLADKIDCHPSLVTRAKNWIKEGLV